MDVDDLYGLQLEEFVPARNTLARELRDSGRREEATAVAALRKPSVAAWAVNQLVRTQRKAASELFEAGDALRAAHERVLAGRGEASGLRAAVDRERAAVDALTDIARGLLTSDGHELSPAIIDRVSDTLHAAALDDDARGQVESARVERELRHVGLGVGASASTAPSPARTPKRAPAGKAPSSAEQRAAERAAAEAAEAAERERAEARAAARATEREARRRLERAERARGAAAERRDRAARALGEADAELAEAETELEEARDELGTAEEALRELGH